MKQKLVVLFLLLTGLVACNKKNLELGTVTYAIKRVAVSSSRLIEANSDVARLYEEYQQSITKINAKYAKEWEYAYSGETIEEALVDEDKRALANSNFDEAVAEYEALAEKLKKTPQDLKGGFFTSVSIFRITRLNKTIKESKELVFKYPSVQ